MDRNWIVLGDPTSSGGSVITGSPFTDIDCIPVARVNDQATCPRHKGAFPIVDGDSTMIVDGQPVALHSSSLACGCKVLSASQIRVFVSQGTGAGAGAASLPMRYSPPARGDRRRISTLSTTPAPAAMPLDPLDQRTRRAEADSSVPGSFGCFPCSGVDLPDATENLPDAGAMSSTSGDFFYFTHDAEGARICYEVGYTPEDRCYYRLDELATLHKRPVVGVRLYGFLLFMDGSLYLGSNREGTGLTLPITQVDDVVPEWLTGRLVETGYLTGLNGQYFPETKTIRAFSFSYVNLPGETPFRVPPPEERLPPTSVLEPTRCLAPRYGEALADDCIDYFGGDGQSSAE